jgi:queuine tRNA-ribosyltransferase
VTLQIDAAPGKTDETTMTDYPGFGFEIVARDEASRARLGRLQTPHGTIMTPAFIFCATKGAVKAAGPSELADANADIILANTYHLLIQPGPDLVARMGGLHKFMAWSGPMLTDSGGFQIFSLGAGTEAEEVKGNRPDKRNPLLTELTDEGATFRSPRDGAYHHLTPEKSIDIQRKLGADLIVVLDECTPFHVDRDYTARSLEMTHRWADRSLAEFERHHDGRQALYGVIQGGIYEDLRREGAEFVASRPFFGHAVGGCLGAHKDQMYDIVDYATRPLAAYERPIHLLGIGGMRDIWEGVALGIDTFDCVTPTRIARHGWAHAQRPPPRGRGSARSGMRLPGLRDRVAGLCASPAQSERNPRPAAPDAAQHDLHDTPDDDDPHGAAGWPLRRGQGGLVRLGRFANRHRRACLS